jgi:asparagine synthetase B (glutamine-hydrolysing)
MPRCNASHTAVRMMQGIYANGSAVLGHRRLSIIDTSAAGSPALHR